MLYLTVPAQYDKCIRQNSERKDRKTTGEISVMKDVPDWRNMQYGSEIPSENYCDQPYLIKTDDGAWLCQMTTGVGIEGRPGQHVVSIRSTDMGENWTDKCDLEPAKIPESSYGVLLKAPSGRVFCFYNHNTDNIREVVADDPPFKGGKFPRVDSLGHFVFKYSDDHGKTWSEKRFEIPVREMEVDRKNPYQGKIRFFWNVGRAFVHEGAACVPLIKIGRFGEGSFLYTEGVLLRSSNLFSEENPENALWETLPEGEYGLSVPEGGGKVAEEHSFVPMDDGSMYVIYRTTDGAPAISYSRDKGRTWEPPSYAEYASGDKVRNPRAACFAWKCAKGRYLLWHHNNGMKGYNNGPSAGSRNVAWLSGGIERDGRILWSEPEIVLYDDTPSHGPSYPDFIEDEGRYFITETQKTIAATHEIPADFMNTLWMQVENRIEGPVDGGLALEASAEELKKDVSMPELPRLSMTRMPGHKLHNTCRGFSIDLEVEFKAFVEGGTVIDTRNSEDRGICVRMHENGSLSFLMNDGFMSACWASDPGIFRTGTRHHAVINIDGGPKVISWVVDGVLCKGGPRPFGWGRFPRQFKNPNGDSRLRVDSSGNAVVHSARIYDRCLMTSEANANYRAVSG